MKSDSPSISVIIPVYNVEKYLERCLDSVLNQSFHNIEIICVDDGSTDSSSEILDRYAVKDTRIRVIHQENRGIAAARNVGLDAVVTFPFLIVMTLSFRICMNTFLLIALKGWMLSASALRKFWKRGISLYSRPITFRSNFPVLSI